MRIIHWGIIINLQTFSLREFQFHLVLLIPYSAIAKTITARSLIFRIFTRVENQPLKQRLKQKGRIIFKNFQIIFSFAKLEIYFLFHKIHYRMKSCKLDPISAYKLIIIRRRHEKNSAISWISTSNLKYFKFKLLVMNAS